VTERPKALVTAPFRGEGLATLERIADVVLDPWIDAPTLRLYKADQLAERVRAEGATILIVESDSVKGPVLECDLRVIGSCRGDPNNVDVEAATRAGIPVLRAPGRNADAVAEMTTSGPIRCTREARSPTNGSARGSSPGGRRASWGSGPWVGPRSGASKASA
jgi:D-3-phosphoglycerate dehydrogenase